MQFEVQKITPAPEAKRIEKPTNEAPAERGGIIGFFGLWRFVLILSLLFIGAGLAAAAQILDRPVQQIITPNFLSPLNQDAEGNTNILLLGVAGATEEGGYLTDSIILMSIDSSAPTVSMVSIPRDTWVNSYDGARKINRVYADARSIYGAERGMEIAKSAVEDFTGVDVHYGVIMDFRLFTEAIDALGGVEIFVPKTIDDPYYPAANYAYQRFYVREGLQTMSGKTALKYARSRQTSSDYARAQRQQDLLLAIKNTAADKNVLTDTAFLTDMWELYQKRVETDMGLTQLMRMAKIGKAITSQEIYHAVLSDDPNAKGGILIPGDKSSYGGQFVLLPETKKEVYNFFDLALYNTSVLLDPVTIEVLNAGAKEGSAGEIAQQLRHLGFQVVNVSNYKKGKEDLVGNYIQRTSTSTSDAAFDYISKLYKARTLSDDDSLENEADIRLLIGQ